MITELPENMRGSLVRTSTQVPLRVDPMQVIRQLIALPDDASADEKSWLQTALENLIYEETPCCTSIDQWLLACIFRSAAEPDPAKRWHFLDLGQNGHYNSYFLDIAQHFFVSHDPNPDKSTPAIQAIQSLHAQHHSLILVSAHLQTVFHGFTGQAPMELFTSKPKTIRHLKESLFGLAKDKIAIGQWVSADRFLSLMECFSPAPAPAIFLRGQWYSEESNPRFNLSKAVHCMEQAIGLSPNPPQEWIDVYSGTLIRHDQPQKARLYAEWRAQVASR